MIKQVLQFVKWSFPQHNKHPPSSPHSGSVRVSWDLYDSSWFSQNNILISGHMFLV